MAADDLEVPAARRIFPDAGEPAKRSGALGLTYLLGEADNGRPGTIDPIRVRMETDLADGASLAGYVWLPTKRDVDIVVLACHGFNHYIGNGVYARLGTELAEHGIAMVGVTVEGHGRSGGLPGWIRNFDRMCEQPLQFLDVVTGGGSADGTASARLVGPEGEDGGPLTAPLLPRGLPTFVLGESMGGAVAVHCCQKRPRLFAGAALLAPMCGIDPGMMPNACLMVVGQGLAACVPTWPVAPVPDRLPVCFHAANTAKLAATNLDTLRYTGRLRIGTGVELHRGAMATAKAASSFATPLLVFHGDDDHLTSAKASAAFFASCKSSDKTYVHCPGARHGLWWEPLHTRQAVLADLLAFFLSRARSTHHRAAIVSYPRRGTDEPLHVGPGEVFSDAPGTKYPDDWPGAFSAAAETKAARVSDADVADALPES